MTDETTAQTPLADPQPAVAAPVPAKARKARTAPGAGLLLPLLALVSLAVSAGVGYLYLQQSSQVVNLEMSIAALQAERTAGSSELVALEQAQRQLDASLRQTLEQQLGDLNQQLASANSRLQAQTAQLEAMGRELVSTNQRIRNANGGAQQDWLLAEAESLLRLAQQYLLIAHDVRTAIGLFVAADDRLRGSTNPAVFAVREVLARELASLQALPSLDVQGLYVQLGAQSEQIDTLTVDSGTGNDFGMPARAAAVTDGWFAEAMDALDQYFVVTKRDQAVTPLLTAEQEYLIRRSVQLQIEQAKLALLQGHAEIYRSALDAAVTAIGTRMQEQDGRRAAVVAALTALRDTRINLDIPPVSNALEALQQIQLTAAEATTAAPAASPDEANQ